MVNIWDEHFWLPENTTWESFYADPKINYPRFDEIPYTIAVGIALTVLRILLESFVFLPIGVAFGWIDTSNESLYSRVIGHLNGGFAGKRKFKRVAECAWRFSYYICIFIIGYFVLRDQPQFAHVSECWKDWPHQDIPNKIWWYYTVETGFYWSLLFCTLFFDIRRSDFWQMMFHHFITILLLSLSFSVNFVRVGTLVLFSHDAADIFIDLGKLFRYAGWQRALTVLYIVFICTWIVTRLIYYPFWVIHSTIYDAPRMIQDNYRYELLTQRPIVPRILVGMLCALVFLHIFWTWLLIKIAIKASSGGELDDVREESDDESEAEPAATTASTRRNKKKD